ncbi:MAG: transmembrane anchor protein [Amphritea sp.]|nr:transmembrane anchor protein [Amphritea sp.]
MFNTNIPTQQELPTSGQLLRSTVIAFVVAIVLLVTTVLPGEYGIDPTGIGRMLGLTEMGEIKEQLADEAAADRAASAAKPAAAAEPAAQPTVSIAVIPQAKAEPAPVKVAAAVQTEATVKKAAPIKPTTPLNQDSITFELRPGQGAEVKLEMRKGAEVEFSWSANGGKLNFDTHGDPYNPPSGFYHGYGKGRFQPGEQGILKAAFDGNHGWFWRNRTKENVTLTLSVQGDFIVMKRVI